MKLALLNLSLSPALNRFNALKTNSLRFGVLYSMDSDSMPADTRMQGKIQMEREGYTRFIPTVAFNEKSQKFVYRLLQFEDESRYYCALEKTLSHGCVLSDEFVVGAVVDQEKGVIRFPNGAVLDGKTGVVKSRGRKVVSHSKTERKDA